MARWARRGITCVGGIRLTPRSSSGPRNPAFVYEAIRAGQRYHFRTKNAALHNAINLTASAILLAAWAALLWAGTRVEAWLYVPLAAVGFGLVYFSLFILVVHEASHSMFLISEQRRLHLWLNRIPGWMVATCFATHYGKHWERGHLEHHVRPLEPGDPQGFNCRVGRSLAKCVALNLFVPGWLFLERTVLRTKRAGGESSSSKGVIVAFVVLWATGLTLSALFLGWQVALAGFLGLHVLSAWNQVKGSLEHGGALAREPNPFFRSRTTLFPGRPLLMPFNITLHFEHHLNFCVPWYDLGRYHRDLKAIVPERVIQDMVNPNPWTQLAGSMGGLSRESAGLVQLRSQS